MFFVNNRLAFRSINNPLPLGLSPWSGSVPLISAMLAVPPSITGNKIKQSWGGNFFCSLSIKVRHGEDKVVWRSLSGLKRMPGQTWLMWLHQKTWILTGTTGFVWLNPLLAFPCKLWGRPIVLLIRIVVKPLDVEYQQVHTAPDWCQPDKLGTLSFSAFCDRDKKPHVG